jgi:hypothetical protein
MTQPREVIKQWIDDVNDTGRNLTQWEKNFMENVTDYFNHGGNLSPTQLERLETIYTEKVK